MKLIKVVKISLELLNHLISSNQAVVFVSSTNKPPISKKVSKAFFYEKKKEKWSLN